MDLNVQVSEELAIGIDVPSELNAVSVDLRASVVGHA